MGGQLGDAVQCWKMQGDTHRHKQPTPNTSSSWWGKCWQQQRRKNILVSMLLKPSTHCQSSHKSNWRAQSVQKKFPLQRKAQVCQILCPLHPPTPGICVTGQVILEPRWPRWAWKSPAKAIRMVTGLRGATYKDKRKELGLHFEDKKIRA